MRKPTKGQAAVLRIVAATKFTEDGGVSREAIRRATPYDSQRHLTGTICACLTHGWLSVPRIGIPEYLLTASGMLEVEKLTARDSKAHSEVAP